MTWRLAITRDIQSDKIKSLHATNTTNSAQVGSGFHITLELANGHKKVVFYRPVAIELSASPQTIQFEIYKEASNNNSVTTVPTEAPSFYNEFVEDAANKFRQEAMRPKSRVTFPRKANAQVNMAATTENGFPPLG